MHERRLTTSGPFSFNEESLNCEWVQSVLQKFTDDLPLFKQIADKGNIRKTKRKIRVFFKSGELIGYLIYSINAQHFTADKKICDEKNSAYASININDIEVRKSIREDKSLPRYGYIIINNFLNDISKRGFDAITLQASNEDLKTYYKKKFKFIDLKSEDGLMVKWL